MFSFLPGIQEGGSWRTRYILGKSMHFGGALDGLAYFVRRIVSVQVVVVYLGAFAALVSRLPHIGDFLDPVNDFFLGNCDTKIRRSRLRIQQLSTCGAWDCFDRSVRAQQVLDSPFTSASPHHPYRQNRE
jgi:hypothetical protein